MQRLTTEPKSGACCFALDDRRFTTSLRYREAQLSDLRLRERSQTRRVNTSNASRSPRCNAATKVLDLTLFVAGKPVACSKMGVHGMACISRVLRTLPRLALVFSRLVCRAAPWLRWRQPRASSLSVWPGLGNALPRPSFGRRGEVGYAWRGHMHSTEVPLH